MNNYAVRLAVPRRYAGTYLYPRNDDNRRKFTLSQQRQGRTRYFKQETCVVTKMPSQAVLLANNLGVRPPYFALLNVAALSLAMKI